MVALALLLTALTVGGLTQLRVDTGVASFVPAGDPALAALEDKARSFGGDPVVVLLESPQPRGLLRDDQLNRVMRLEGALAKTPDVAEVYGPGTAVNQIAISARNLLAQISGRRDVLRATAEAQARSTGADPGAAAAAGNAALVDFDRRYGSLIVSALPAGLPTIANPRFVDAVVFGRGPEARPQWAAIVPRDDAVAVLVRPRAGLDQTGTAALVEGVRARVAEAGLATARVTVSGVPAVTAALSDRARAELPLLGLLAVGVVGGLYLLVPWSRRRRDRWRPLVATFAGTLVTLAAFGWVGRPLSLGVVAFLPILLGIGSDFPLYLAQPARWRRVAAAALAGAAGFAALAASSLPFVRELGLALAVGLLATVAAAWALRRWLNVVEPTEAADGWSTAVGIGVPRPRRSLRAAALVAALLVAGAGWFALPRLEVQADPQELARGLPALQDAQYTESVLGAAGELNVGLQGPDVLSPDALAWSREAEARITTGFGDRLHPITTVSDLLRFLGTTPDATQIQGAYDLLPSYLSSAVVRPDRQASVMVLGLELSDVGQQRALIDAVRAALPPPPEGYRADVVGLPAAAAAGYDAVSAGRLWINLLAVVLAAVVLLIGLRDVRDAGRGVLTMLFSTGWILAGTWLLDGSLSPLTVAVGALTAATGCEFAVMLTEARRYRRGWLVRSVALATGAAVLGYLVLTASELAVLREFGLLLAAGVAASALAALAVVAVLFPPREEHDHGDHGGAGPREVDDAERADRSASRPEEVTV